jgi:hypothetical protein
VNLLEQRVVQRRRMPVSDDRRDTGDDRDERLRADELSVVDTRLGMRSQHRLAGRATDARFWTSSSRPITVGNANGDQHPEALRHKR